MSIFSNATNVSTTGGTYNSVKGDQINFYTTNSPTVFEILAPKVDDNATYDSESFQSTGARTCEVGTRQKVLKHILEWADQVNHSPICWLYGPAGSGKSTIALTIAKHFAENRKLGGSFFFRRAESSKDITRLVPTLAYQLSRSFPLTETEMHNILQTDRTILSKSLEYQFQRLLVDIIPTSSQPLPSIIIVVDAVDECDRERSVEQVLAAIAQAYNNRNPPFVLKFLLTSRLDYHLHQMLPVSVDQSRIYTLDLQKFEVQEDILAYFKSQFSVILRRHSRVMQEVEKPWPSDEDLDELVKKSEGLFLYASTVIKYIDDGDDLPQRKLQIAMEAHDGLDPLYTQVFSTAPIAQHRQRIIAIQLLLRQPLPLQDVARLLHIESGNVSAAFRGLYSIYIIPETDDGFIRPLHASLHDYLMDKNRSNEYFIDPEEHHALILNDCVKLVTAHMEGTEKSRGVTYACLNWCYHCACALEGQRGMDHISSLLASDHWEDFLENILTEWNETWMSVMGSDAVLQTTHSDIVGAILSLKKSGSHNDTRKSLSKIATAVHEQLLGDGSAESQKTPSPGPSRSLPGPQARTTGIRTIEPRVSFPSTATAESLESTTELLTQKPPIKRFARNPQHMPVGTAPPTWNLEAPKLDDVLQQIPPGAIDRRAVQASSFDGVKLGRMSPGRQVRVTFKNTSDDHVKVTWYDKDGHLKIGVHGKSPVLDHSIPPNCIRYIWVTVNEMQKFRFQQGRQIKEEERIFTSDTEQDLAKLWSIQRVESTYNGALGLSRSNAYRQPT